MFFKPYWRKLSVSFLLLLGFQYLSATHNRAGEISIEQVGDCTESLTVRATVVTYTKASSRPADRDSLTICWGDGTCETVLRVNGAGFPPQGEPLENDTKRNLYVAIHTYAARGTYAVSMTDPNRNADILNVNFPNSVQVKFHIQTTYTFLNPQFQGCNNTPSLLQPPIDIGCVGKVFTHNPNAYDPDGDSLAYKQIVPLSDVNMEVPRYKFPDEVESGADNILTINEITGDINWDAPQRPGEYNYAIIIVEFREGIPIDTIIRDMQILVEECENDPPEVLVDEDEICVVAGELIELEVVATAPEYERNQKVRLTALGGPFEVPFSAATFTPGDNFFKDDPNRKLFRWQTTCDHISDQYYSVVFKAVDNYYADTFGLATLKTVRIKVVGPPPQGVLAEATKEQITLTWDNPYFECCENDTQLCEDAGNEYFRGFTVWRRLASNQFPEDTCQPGLEGRGYTKLTPVAIDSTSDGRYIFTDNNVERGRTYCYRVLGEFARTTPAGSYTYNTVESLPSLEVCIQLGRDVPLITHVDVQTTSTSNGDIQVCWTKPLAEDLDTTINPGPYIYEVLRGSVNGGEPINPDNLEPIGARFESPTFAGANDTCFIDSDLNTRDQSYYYQVNFYVNNESVPLGKTNIASSIYLTATPTDRKNILTWLEDVPWDNFEYIVYRQNDQGAFDSIALVNEARYEDVGLENGTTYCYKIQSYGSYGVMGVIDPILNFSQEACATPRDDVPTCPPELMVSNLCDQDIECTDENQVFNNLSWLHPRELCDDAEDVVAYQVYYAPFDDVDLELVARVEGGEITFFDHQPPSGLAGCYAVTAIDTSSNESAFSNIVCVDNCPSYLLPNTFTPNSDGQNDLFIPYPFCFVESVEFKVFNRWGQLVFETADPNLNWDGKNLNGDDLAAGTYYYTCQVFERRVDGVIPDPELRKGWIELVR